MKDKKFELFAPASGSEIEDLQKALRIFDSNISSLESVADIKKYTKFCEIFNAHCVTQTYFFEVKKCHDPLCEYHRAVRTDEVLDHSRPNYV